MAEGSSEIDKKTECEMAIAYVSDQISLQYAQYPNFAHHLKIHCTEEAFEDIEILMDDVAEGFDESVILEAIADDIEIQDEDKEALCNNIYTLLCTFVPPRPEPSSLDLSQLHTDYNENDMQCIKQLVSLQANLLEPTNADVSIYKVLIIGEKNHLPLLSYLVDTYNRCRLALYFDHKLKFEQEVPRDHSSARAKQFVAKHAVKMLQLDDFCAICPTMQQLAIEENDVLSSYKSAMKSCVNRNGLFYCLPLIEQNASKINDSVHIFCLYSISILKATNDLIKNKYLTHFPVQIDIWIIPKHIAQQQVFDDDDNDDDNKDANNFDIYHGLHQCDNVQKIGVAPDVYNMYKLSEIFTEVLQNVLKKQTRKRMVIIIDRRKQKENDRDTIYAYLAPNSQNIPQLQGSGYEYRHLYESMANLTKREILPSYDEDGELDENTINANSGFMNMFVLSLHLHKLRDVAIYWHYCGSCNRFAFMDMLTLWPLHFNYHNIVTNENGLDSVAEKYLADNDCIENYLMDETNFDQLIDVNFKAFYEINTMSSWKDTVAPPFRARPSIMRRNSDEERLDFDKWLKNHKKEEGYRARKEQRKKSKKMKRAKTGLLPKERHKPMIKKQRTFAGHEGDIKLDQDTEPVEKNEDEKEEKIEELELAFVYKDDFDTNGLLYFLGSYAGRKTYQNPAGEIRQLVDVTLSSRAKDSKSEMYFVGRECVRCMTENKQPSYMKLNLRSVAIKLTRYTLRHHNSHNVALTNWTLEGSNDGNKWTILKNHIFDTSLQKPGDSQTWIIDTNANDYFTQFRIYMTDVNNSGRWYLGCSGIELYGTAHGGLVSDSLRPDFDEKLQLLDADNMNVLQDVDSLRIVALNADNLAKSHHNLPLNVDNNKSSPLMRTAKSLGHLTRFVSKKSVPSPKNHINNLKIRWNVYPKLYKKCIQSKGKVICRNEKKQCAKFITGCSSGINRGSSEFKIKYESTENEQPYCTDIIGIISNVQQCRDKNRWFGDMIFGTESQIDGMCYVYCGGCGHSVVKSVADGQKGIENIANRWRPEQILTVRVHCYLDKCSFINFFIDDKKISHDIPIKYDQLITYYPVLFTQTNNTKFTVV